MGCMNKCQIVCVLDIIGEKVYSLHHIIKEVGPQHAKNYHSVKSEGCLALGMGVGKKTSIYGVCK